MVSSPDFGNSLTVPGTASAHYTLAVMTVVAADLRRRPPLPGLDVPRLPRAPRLRGAAGEPVDLLARKTEG